MDEMDIEFSRRHFLFGLGALTCCCGVMGWPQLSFANASTDKRLMVVILRGAMDGLAAVAPYKDASYYGVRGKLALPDTALLPLDGYFGMHKALQPLHALYTKKELAIVHAVATPYRERSHFDAQDLLENGSIRAHGLSSGWMGRTLQAMGATTEGLAIGPSIPLVLQGGKHVQSWAPSTLPEVDVDYMDRIMKMYEKDSLLSSALMEAQGMSDVSGGDGKKGPRQFIDMMRAAAEFMVKPDGARLASIDIGGWDTHANQGTETGRLAQVLGVLAEGIAAYREAMAPVWKDTAVLVITEFGRTVHDNGTGGTDHGTGTVAFLLGGAVNGGTIVGDWPTLADKYLYEGRDLYPSNDLRSLQKAVLEQHLSIPRDVTETVIFPDSEKAKAFSGMFRVNV